MHLESQPINTLRNRIRDGLASLFNTEVPAFAAQAPDTIDVIGGLLAGNGGPMCRMAIDRCACVVAQRRGDRQIAVFDFSEYDLQRPFTLQMSVDALLNASIAGLQRNLAEPGRRFAEPVIAAILALHQGRIIDFETASFTGLNLAMYRDEAAAAGTSSAMLVAAVLAVAEATAENRPSGPLEMVQTCVDAARIARLRVSRLEIQSILQATPRSLTIGDSSGSDANAARAVRLPEGVRVVSVPGIDPPDIAVLARVDVTAKMAHALILKKMRDFGVQAGRELVSDPMNGHLGNLLMDHYKRFFRGALPESMTGEAFLASHGTLADATIEPSSAYAIQFVADHLVIEAHRVVEFARHVAEAGEAPDAARRKLSLDKAGHLMYASHASAADGCGFGSAAADRVVKRLRENEWAGLFGGRLGTTGELAVICRNTPESEQILRSLAAEEVSRSAEKEAAGKESVASADKTRDPRVGAPGGGASVRRLDRI